MSVFRGGLESLVAKIEFIQNLPICGFYFWLHLAYVRILQQTSAGSDS